MLTKKEPEKRHVLRHLGALGGNTISDLKPNMVPFPRLHYQKNACQIWRGNSALRPGNLLSSTFCNSKTKTIYRGRLRRLPPGIFVFGWLSQIVVTLFCGELGSSIPPNNGHITLGDVILGLSLS